MESGLKISKERYLKIQKILLKNTPVEIYKMVLSGELQRFPNGFWGMPENYKYAKECTIYLVEHLLGYDPRSDEFKRFMRDVDATALFKKYKLMTVYKGLFNCSKYDVLTNAYGNIYAIWEVQGAVPNGYWSDFENVKNAIKWLFEYKYKIDIVGLSQKGIVRLPNDVFKIEGLSGIVGIKNITLRELIGSVYPEANLNNITIGSKYADEMNSGNALEIYKRVIKSKNASLPKHFWESEEVRKVCIRYLVEDILKIKNIQEEAYKITLDIMQKHNMQILLAMYDCDKYKIFKEVYPELKEWQLNTKNGYWEIKENRITAIKDVLGENIRTVNEEDFTAIREKLKKNKLHNIFYQYYTGITALLEEVYGIKPWEGRTPVGYWKDSQNVKYAIEWFIDEKLEGKYEHLEKLSRKELYEYLKPYGMTGIVKLYQINGKDFIEIYKR